MGFVRYFSDVKDDKHTKETIFHTGNVRFFLPFICEIGVSGFTLLLNIKSGNSGELFFNNAAKQMTK